MPYGQVGEVDVNRATEEILLHTPFEEMKELAAALYEQYRGRIEAPFK